jgi:2-haloacid dehalogenase
VALPKNLTFVSLEVYGTLIDWESGIYQAFQREAEKDGFTIDRDRLIPLFMETQREIMAGSYELYAEVLRRTAVRCAEELGWELEPVRSSFLPNSIPSWPPFRDSKTRWVHIATGLETDVLPCIKLKVPVIWVDRKKEEFPTAVRGKPTETVKDLRTAVKLLGA